MTKVAKCLATLVGPGLSQVWDVLDTPQLRSDAELAIHRAREKAYQMGYAVRGQPLTDVDKDPAQYALVSTVAFCLAQDHPQAVGPYLLGLFILRGDPLFSVRGSVNAEGVSGTYKAIADEQAFDIAHKLALGRYRPPVDGGHRMRVL